MAGYILGVLLFVFTTFTALRSVRIASNSNDFVESVFNTETRISFLLRSPSVSLEDVLLGWFVCH